MLNLPNSPLPLLPALEAHLLPPFALSHSALLLLLSTRFIYLVGADFVVSVFELELRLVDLSPLCPSESLTQKGGPVSGC